MKAKVIIFTITLLVLVLSQAHAQRTIQFAGRTWYVKSGYGGPGPNYWSDSQQSVWVDGSGLHLKIRNISGTWYCSEVWTQLAAHYGMHRFYVNSRLDSLDKNVVAALFLYANDTTEADIEFSKWGLPNPGYNAQFVVQPGYRSGNLDRYLMSLNGTYTTHYFNWQRDSIRFKSIHGNRPDDSLGYYLIHQWRYTGSDNPRQAESLHVRISLWLYQGQAPSDGREVEFIVTRADLPSGVEESNEDDLHYKSKFVVAPNPMTNTAFLTMNTQVKGKAKVSLYNITGYMVKSLEIPTNRPTAWDARGSDGRKLPAGVYFLRATAGDFTATEKVVITR